MVLPKEQHDTPEKARCRTELSVHKWRCMVECDVCGPVPESKSSKYSTFPLCEVTCTPKCKLKCAQNFPDEARAKCRLLHHKAFCKGECRYVLKDFPLTFCDPPGGRLGLKRVVGKYLNLKPSSAKSRLKGRNYTKAAPNAQTCAYCRHQVLRAGSRGGIIPRLRQMHRHVHTAEHCSTAPPSAIASS